MKPAQVDVLFAMFAYGGNGGVPMTIPGHVTWVSRTYEQMAKDERIGRISIQTLSDTPIPMQRNKAVKTAQESGYDVLLMLDSDNLPDCELKDDPTAKPFWSTSFDFLYERLMRGVPTLICAPYCGPPPMENVYVFYWEGHEDSPHSGYALQPYSRDTAARMSGIHPAAAGPTGVALYTTGIFQLMNPPYFYYEYKDEPYQTEKASTEDVTNFRDLAMSGVNKYKEDVVFCNWDAWASHAKVKYVRKPRIVMSTDVNSRFRDAILRNESRQERIVDVGILRGDKTQTLPEDAVVHEVDYSNIDARHTEVPVVSSDSSGETGVVVKKRNVLGRVVTSVGHQTPMADLEALHDIVELVAQNHRRDIRVIEVGCWVGESSVAIASAFRTDGSVVYCVDNFSGGNGETSLTRVVEYMGGPDVIEGHFKANTGEWFGGKIKLIKGESSEVAASLDAQEADVVFVDVAHSLVDCLEAIESWLPHVNREGLLCGHDYLPAVYPGVVEAVQRLFGDKGVTVRQPAGTALWCIDMREYYECLTKNSDTASV